MVSRLQSWVFISLSMLLMGFALFPVLRVIVGVDDEFGMQFLTVVMLLIAGLMCGLTGMLLLARTFCIPRLPRQRSNLFSN